MSASKHWLLGGQYSSELIIHQVNAQLSESNKNVDMSSSAHDAFLARRGSSTTSF